MLANGSERPQSSPYPLKSQQEPQSHYAAFHESSESHGLPSEVSISIFHPQSGTQSLHNHEQLGMNPEHRKSLSELLPFARKDTSEETLARPLSAVSSLGMYRRKSQSTSGPVLFLPGMMSMQPVSSQNKPTSPLFSAFVPEDEDELLRMDMEALELDLPVEEEEPRISFYQGFRALYPSLVPKPSFTNGLVGLGLASFANDTPAMPKPREKKSHDRPHVGVANVSRIFTKLLDDRDDTLEQCEYIEAQRLTLTDEMRQVEDLMSQLHKRKREIRHKLRGVLRKEDHVNSIYNQLNERISEMASATYDYEMKMRSIKGDSEALKMAAQMAESTDEPEVHSCIKTLFGHEDSVETIDLDMPYGILVTGSADRKIRVWDTSTYQCHAEILAHTGWVRSVQILGKTVMSGSGDHTIKQWDISVLPPLPNTELTPSVPYATFDLVNESTAGNSDILVHTYEGHNGGVSCIQFDSSWLLSGSLDKTIRQWDIETGETVSILKSESWMDCTDKADVILNGIPGASTPFAPSYLDSIGGEDRIWNGAADWFSRPPTSKHHAFDNPLMYSQGQTGPCKVKVYHTGGFVGALQFWKHALASGYGDGNIRLWDLRTSSCHRTIKGHSAAVTALAFDDTHIVTGSVDKSVKIFDLRNGAICDEIVFSSGINSVSFDTWKILVATGSRDVQVYSRTNGTIHPIPDHGLDLEDNDYDVGKGFHTKSVRCVKIVKDWGLSGGLDGIVNIWKL